MTSMPPPILHKNYQDLYYVTIAVYILLGLSLFFGITAIPAILINYIKKEDVKNTWLESHFAWQIKTFWVALFFSLLGALLSVVVVGLIILGVVWVWVLYRVLKGFFAVTERKPLA